MCIKYGSVEQRRKLFEQFKGKIFIRIRNEILAM